MSLTFRRLGPADGPAMLDVGRRCPVEASLRLLFDRGDDFFAWPDRVFERHEHAGAFADGALVGYAMLAEQTGWLGDRVGRYGYFGDVRVLPAWRRQGVAGALIDRFRASRGSDVDLGFMIIADGNVAAARGAEGYAEVGPATRLDVWTVPLVGARRFVVPAGHEVRPAEPGDLDEAAALFRRHHGRSRFAPDLDGAGLAARLARFRLPLSTLQIARRGGQIVAVGAPWDMAPFHVTRVLGYDARGQLQRLAWAAAACAYGGARPPAPGEALRALTLSTVAADDAAALRALLASAARGHADHHVLHVAAAGDAARALDGWRATRLTSRVHLISRAGGRLDDGPIYVDLAAI